MSAGSRCGANKTPAGHKGSAGGFYTKSLNRPAVSLAVALVKSSANLAAFS
jgi:hypothetical protein